MNSVNDVAAFFLSKDSMSPKKLQKLVYYAYCWTLTLLNVRENLSCRLFDEKIEAWAHGPVIPSLYHEFKGYGWNDIPRTERKCECEFDQQVQDILERVWNEYGSYSADQLELMTHRDLPWQNVRRGYAPFTACNNALDDDDIYNWFSTRELK